jgi:LysR family transcriptional regulator, benzoate and cis,cis-muconate-responsive activator of ben and cat genes
LLRDYLCRGGAQDSQVRSPEAAQQVSREYRGELRIANVGLICPSLLARMISTFRERFPKVEVSIVQQNNFTWIEAVQKRAEIGIGYLPVELTGYGVGALSSLIVATAPIGVAVAVTRENDYRRETKLQDFAHEPFLILDPKYAPGYLEWTRSIFLQTGFEPAKTVLIDSAEAYFTLIRAGIGVGLLSSLHLGGQSAGVSFRKLTESVADFPLSLVWDPQRASPLVNDFLRMAREFLPKSNGSLSTNNQAHLVAARMNGV